MADLLNNPPLDIARADYNIYRYTDQIYKIIHFKSTVPIHLGSDPAKNKHYDHKLDASLSRARRVILELALCNPWCYFCTFTLSSGYDRNDLHTWAERFSQWIRDQRKKHGIDIPYVLVPELHEKGGWHMHGLFGDISPFLESFRVQWERGEKIPWKLVAGDYYDWPDYHNKFGFCSFGRIKNPVAVSFYITKYISKSMAERADAVGLHLYYCSRGLNRSTFHGDVYGNSAYLNQFLTNHYEFCSIGMTHVKDGLTWSFAMELMDYLPLDNDYLEAFGSDPNDCLESDQYFEAVQAVLEGFR